jgi:cadherin EGF LAG seven-pass G-type receptor 1
VTRRYGVDVEIATSVLSLTILVPSFGGFEKVTETTKQMERMRVDQHLDNRIDETPLPRNPDEIRITAHDVVEHESHDDIDGFVISPKSNDGFESDAEEIEIRNEANDVATIRVKKHTKRDVKNPDDKVVYRSLGSPHLSQPIRVQMWLNIDKARFSPRLNPQCVRWHTFNNQWTRIGCQTEIPDYDKVNEDGGTFILINCTCTSVSSYAVVIDVIDPEDIPDPSFLVQITSFSAFTVSLPILFCVIVALALLRGMQTNSNTIHQNLIFCIFSAELLFFVAWQARRSLVDNDVSVKILISFC